MKTNFAPIALFYALLTGAAGTLSAQENTKKTQNVKVYVKEVKDGKETSFEANELTPEVEQRLSEMGITLKSVKNSNGFSYSTQVDSEKGSGTHKNAFITMHLSGGSDSLNPDEISNLLKVTSGEEETTININGEETYVKNNNGKPITVVKVYNAFVFMQNATAEERKKAGIPESKSSLTVSNMLCTPNPSKGEFTISFKSPDKEASELTIRDSNGKITHTETLSSENGYFTKTIDLGSVPKGMYLVTITQNGKAVTKKMLVE